MSAQTASLCAVLICLAVSVHGIETVLPAADSSVRWVGRMAAQADGSVALDWEGVTAQLNLVAPWTYLVVNISDSCAGSESLGGGSRWLVRAESADGHASPVGHRVSTFFSGPRVSEHLLLSNPGGGCNPGCTFAGATSVALTRLTESRLSGCSANANLAVVSFATDGTFGAVPPPPPHTPARRLEFVGDSISAGDLNDGTGATLCGNNAFNDDVTLTSGALVCTALSAECATTAWGGITLGARGWGMRDLYPMTFSSHGADAYAPWSFASFPVDGVVINLGTNDRPAPGDAQWIDAYASFAGDIVHKYYNNPSLALFLGYGPMTDEYEGNVRAVVANLTSAGLRAFVLDLTLNHSMTGCYGHPSAQDNVEIAAKATPQIAAALGWA